MDLNPIANRVGIWICLALSAGCTAPGWPAADPAASPVRTATHHATSVAAVVALGAGDTPRGTRDTTQPRPGATGETAFAGARPHPATRPAPAAVAVAEETLSIDLPTALRLAEAQNYKIAVARERINEAQARYEGARLLLLPTLNPGFSYAYHRGRLQETNGNIVEVDRASGFGGLGAGAVGAGAVVPPGVSIVADLSSVLFEPLAARQNRNVARSRAASVRNLALLDVALAYYDLLHAKGQLAISHDSAEQTAELAELTARYAETGVGLQSDAQRVVVERILRANDLLRSRETVRVRSAILAGLLQIDATVVLDPVETDVVPVTMVEHDGVPDGLIATALGRNPALLERQARTAYEHERYRQSQVEPWLPRVALNASVGSFRGEAGGHTLADGGSRVDYNAQIYWSLGFDQVTNAHRQRSRYRQARLEQEGAEKNLAAAVVQAHYQVVSTKDRIALTAPAVESARRSMQLNQDRILDRQGLPIEVLQSIDSLTAAREAYLNAVIEHNQAQFRLYTAIGQPPAEANPHD